MPRLRPKATKTRRLRRLYRKYYGVCGYCGSLTVPIHDIPAISFIRRKAYTVEFLLGNGIKTEVPFATIEHINDRDLGGTNSPTNLMLSCAKCNNKKNREKLRSRSGRRNP